MNMKLIGSNKGFGVGSAVVVLGIVLAALYAIQMRTSTAFKAGSYDEQLQGIEAIKRTIRKSLDCGQTLGIAPSPTPPAKESCASFAGLRPIKNTAGDTLDFSPFKISVGCEKNMLIAKITSGPKNMLLKNQKWEDTKLGKDIFSGSEEICRSYFDPAYPFTWKIGGTYMVNNLWAGTDKFCRHKNPATLDCSCPKNYSKNRTYEFYNKGCGTNGNPGYYQDSGAGDKSPNCSVVQYVCISWM